jgi:hypothetical protein
MKTYFEDAPFRDYYPEETQRWRKKKKEIRKLRSCFGLLGSDTQVDRPPCFSITKEDQHPNKPSYSKQERAF